MTVKNSYETTYIITPELANEDFLSIIEKFNRVLKENGAEIVSQEVWGFRKLAYEIKRKNSGYYVFIEFNAPGTIVEVLEREYSYDDRLLRYLTVSLDKFALAYNIKRRAKIKENGGIITKEREKPPVATTPDVDDNLSDDSTLS